MKNLKNKLLIVGVVFFSLGGFSFFHESSESEGSYWRCEGYCFLGGDVPTNPFQPVSATGATEEEARENIDCGPYQETDISCRLIKAQ